MNGSSYRGAGAAGRLPFRLFNPLALVLVLVAAGGVAPRRLHAQEITYPDPETFPRPEARAVRTVESPRIDGDLADAVWAQAPVISDFIQSQPLPGAPATERTEVRMLYDDDALYIAVLNWDSDTRNLVVKSLERDFPNQSTRDADMFSLTLDTFLDRRNSFIYLINPYGAYRDGQTFDDSRTLDFGWNGVMDVRTRILEDHWTIEIEIPWSSLRFTPSEAEQSWGLNMGRRVRRRNEDSYWAPVDRRDPVHRMSKAGTLHGFQGLQPGRNLSVKPYLLGENVRGAQVPGEAAGSAADGGADLKWGINPELTLDLTWRTDFSQVEVDQERVNLTRFPLFFEERRDFFLENSGVFTFGDVTERNYRQGSSLRDFTLFQSRRIGLEGGLPVPIVAGARLTGGMGGFEVGFLNMQTEAEGTAPAQNFTVARLRRNILSGSDVGVLLAHRTPTDSGFEERENTSLGVDANLRFGDLIVGSYWARSDTPGAGAGPDGGREGWQDAWKVGVAFRNQRWNTSAQVRQVDEDFTPGVGFIRRTDIRQHFAALGILHRPASIPWLIEFEPYVEFDYTTDLQSRLVSREGVGGISADLRDGGVFGASVTDRFEALDVPFRVGSQVTLPVGNYTFQEGALTYSSNAGRPLSGSVNVGGGSYYTGDRRSVGVNSAWQANHQFALDLSVDYNRLDFPGVDSFTSSVYRARVKYGLSTRAFLSAFVQYNDAAEQVVTNVRFNFIHAPLSHLYLVFRERRDAGSREVLERVFTAKLTKYVGF